MKDGKDNIGDCSKWLLIKIGRDLLQLDILFAEMMMDTSNKFLRVCSGKNKKMLYRMDYHSYHLTYQEI